MKNYIICILSILFVVVSCKEEAVPKPDNLLSKDKMAAILYDVTLINAVKGVNKKKLEESLMHLDSYIYLKHETDSLQFVSSNNYYAANPTVYNEIYRIVQAKLTEERELVGEELKAEQKRRDSIQEAKKLERKKNDTLPKPKFNQVKKK
ncbi:DUF4296 domain-containing protein [Kordia algicida OT-1]|uniref:DUF4296 domain-containing protein n=1 Tax=Kordia algicida OT-1 TaxID=391587 RepID=A9DKW5_9FLAO|nr:DUF4296 domain-containing protein [Kordia algicida]EDP98416.1 hypothetical protein KAOT1_14402 [Kordia algicida OT-1]